MTLGIKVTVKIEMTTGIEVTIKIETTTRIGKVIEDLLLVAWNLPTWQPPLAYDNYRLGSRQ